MPGGDRNGPGWEWQRRYSSRASTLREAHARQWVDQDLVTWDPDGPYPGIDGAKYHPGGLDINKGFPEPLPVVLVTTRAMTEVITGWGSWPEATGWVASRGTTGSGEFAPPAAAVSARCVREETILAHALRHPGDLPALAGYLPPDTWTSDVRYDAWAATLTVWQAGERICRETVAIALAARAALIPARQWQEHYGGRGLPWAMAYLRRLDQTLPAPDAARSAAVSLRGEDQQATARQASRRTPPPGPRREVHAHARRVSMPARPAPGTTWTSPAQQASARLPPSGLSQRPQRPGQRR
jgi:hypothetical protein